MRYVAFEDKQASVLGFGCGSVMGRVGRRQSLRAMQQAWAGGVTLFDTARSYGYGEAEGLLGEFLQGKREQAVVVTKFGIEAQRQAAWKHWAKPVVRMLLRAAPQARVALRKSLGNELGPVAFHAVAMRRSLEQSLRALQTDYVDALLMHLPDENALHDEALLLAMEDVVHAGKVRMLGVSTELFLPSVSLVSQLQVVQLPINFLNFEAASKAVANCSRHTIVANHCFAGGQRAALGLRALQRARDDFILDANLRERLRGNPKRILAEVAFDSAKRAGASMVVASMLQSENVSANIAAMDQPQFSVEELAWLRETLTAA